MAENWRKTTAKAAWGKLSQERYEYLRALKRIKELAHKALNADTSEADAWTALAYIEELADEVIPAPEDEEDGGCACA